MEKLKFFLKYSQTLSALGLILILFAMLDIMGAKILTLHFRLNVAVALLGLYHILFSAAHLIEPEN
jgi:hypothetical protein